MSSPRQTFARMLLGELFSGDRCEVKSKPIAEECPEVTLEQAVTVLDDLEEAEWIERHLWRVEPTDWAWGHLRERGNARPIEILFDFDSTRRTGERCIECGADTLIDAQYSVGSGANFCGACGNQLKPDDVLEIRERTSDDIRED